MIADLKAPDRGELVS